MSSLNVRFVGPVRRPGPQRVMEVDRAGLVSVGDLLERLGYSAEERRGLHVIAEGSRRSHEDPLDDVTSVEILVAIGGG